MGPSLQRLRQSTRARFQGTFRSARLLMAGCGTRVPKPGSSGNFMRTIGFAALWLYVFSLAALVNETSADLLGLKPYVTTIGGPIMAVALLCSGTIFRGLRTKSGMLWAVMIFLMGLGLPLSVYRSDSLAQWLQYGAKIYPLLFFIVAAAITVRQCERLLFSQNWPPAVL